MLFPLFLTLQAKRLIVLSKFIFSGHVFWAAAVKHDLMAHYKYSNLIIV